MPNRTQPQPQETIDIFEYLNVLKNNIVWILLVGILCGWGGYYYSSNYITPVYEASINLIVNADTEAATMVTISDVHSAASLVDTYAVIIKSNRVLDRVVEELGLNMTWSKLNDKVSVSAVNETSVMNVSVRDNDPDEALRIVLKISEVAPGILVQAVRAGSCEIVSDAYSPGYPISPNVKQYSRGCFVMGAGAVAALVFLLHFFNNTVSDDEELKEMLGLPVLGVIPEVDGNRREKRRK